MEMPTTSVNDLFSSLPMDFLTDSDFEDVRGLCHDNSNHDTMDGGEIQIDRSSGE